MVESASSAFFRTPAPPPACRAQTSTPSDSGTAHLVVAILNPHHLCSNATPAPGNHAKPTQTKPNQPKPSPSHQTNPPTSLAMRCDAMRCFAALHYRPNPQCSKQNETSMLSRAIIPTRQLVWTVRPDLRPCRHSTTIDTPDEGLLAMDGSLRFSPYR